MQREERGIKNLDREVNEEELGSIIGSALIAAVLLARAMTVVIASPKVPAEQTRMCTQVIHDV